MTSNAMEPIPVVLLLTFMLLAASIDVREHRVPNVLVGVLLVSGLLFATFDVGQQSLPTAFGGFALGLLVFMPYYLLNGIGAADVKLMAAAGTILGPLPTLVASIAAIASGAIFAALFLAFVRMKQSSLRRTSEGSGSSAGELMEASKIPLPFVPFLAAGVFAAALYQLGVQA